MRLELPGGCALLLLSACHGTTPAAAPRPTEPTQGSARPTHWGYAGDLGPDRWAGLSPVYAACGGQRQSPIDLPEPGGRSETASTLDYKSTGLTIAHHEHVTDILDNGHTIQVSVDEGSTLVTKRGTYHLKQFHFHTPSEHTIHGKSFPMEAHFVHQSDTGEFAVLAVLLEEGTANANLAMLIANFPAAMGDTKFLPQVRLDLNLHLPRDSSAYHYIGSFTTPPCTENVEWLVISQRVSASAEQLSAFAERLHGNNRPTQSTNQRPVLIGAIEGSEQP